MKAKKLYSHHGITCYEYGIYIIRVERRTISKRLGCGYRKTETLADWQYHLKGCTGTTQGRGGLRDAISAIAKL